MGLPIWRDPEESKPQKDVLKSDPTAEARSPIRRRPEYGRSFRRRRRSFMRDPMPPPPPPPPAPVEPRIDLQEDRISAARSQLQELRSLFTEDAPARLRDDDHATSRAPRMTAAELRELTREMENDFVDFRQRLERVTARVDDVASRLRTSPERRAQSDATPTSPSPRAPVTMGDLFLYHRDMDDSVETEVGRPRSRHGEGERGSTLPTPPRDESEDSDSLFVAEYMPSTRPHPLRNSWRPASPINGLGDRNRSPTPADRWEVMQSTIAPDTTLPSADSSFASAAASNSFSSNGTSITEPDLGRTVSRSGSPPALRTTRTRFEYIPARVNREDYECSPEDRVATASFAQIFYTDRILERGVESIRHLLTAYEQDGYRYASLTETLEIEMGFRLIVEALTVSGSGSNRDRLVEMSRVCRSGDERSFEEWLFEARPQIRRDLRRRPQITDDEPPSPHPELYSTEMRQAVREASDRLHDYFHRFPADSLNDSETESRNRTARRPPTLRRTDSRTPLNDTSPPPYYEPLRSHPDVNSFSSRGRRYRARSRDPSPPSARSERDISDALLSGDEQELDAIRRVVERYAQMENVPDEWWMSMGLNLSRTQARTRSRSPERRVDGSRALSPDRLARVAGGRVERAGRHRSPRL